MTEIRVSTPARGSGVVTRWNNQPQAAYSRLGARCPVAPISPLPHRVASLPGKEDLKLATVAIAGRGVHPVMSPSTMTARPRRTSPRSSGPSAQPLENQKD